MDSADKDSTIEEGLLARSDEPQESPRPLTSQRVRAVRGEIINALSFLSVLSTLWQDEGLASIGEVFFLIIGWGILAIDAYFIYCQWNLQHHHPLPYLKRMPLAALDDLVSDLPQTLWILWYIVFHKFSLIAMVCAVHSFFSIVEGLVKVTKD